MAEPTGDAYTQAVTTLLPYLLSHRSRLAAFTASQAPTSATASQAASTANASTATAVSQAATASRASSTDRSWQAPPNSAAPTSDFGQASEAEAPSTSYSQATAGDVPGSPVRSRPQEFLASLQPEQRHRLAVLVDTAILKVAGAWSRSPACCHLGSAVLLLTAWVCSSWLPRANWSRCFYW